MIKCRTSRWTLCLHGVAAGGSSTCCSRSFSGESSRSCSSCSAAVPNDATPNSRHLARMSASCFPRVASRSSATFSNNICSSAVSLQLRIVLGDFVPLFRAVTQLGVSENPLLRPKLESMLRVDADVGPPESPTMGYTFSCGCMCLRCTISRRRQPR